jgi:hypothetical protein
MFITIVFIVSFVAEVCALIMMFVLCHRMLALMKLVPTELGLQ